MGPHPLSRISSRTLSPHAAKKERATAVPSLLRPRCRGAVSSHPRAVDRLRSARIVHGARRAQPRWHRYCLRRETLRNEKGDSAESERVRRVSGARRGLQDGETRGHGEPGNRRTGQTVQRRGQSREARGQKAAGRSQRTDGQRRGNDGPTKRRRDRSEEKDSFRLTECPRRFIVPVQSE